MILFLAKTHLNLFYCLRIVQGALSRYSPTRSYSQRTNGAIAPKFGTCSETYVPTAR